MTFYKVLAKAERDDGVTVTAYEYAEKYRTRNGYEIIESIDSLAVRCTPCARTTWKRKFNELANIRKG